ncbi:hypothetical protein DAEQUDRAFT_332183 [Daedalea quercina L-15889]|uniref:Uncharacterized protein n=1 Tax=Daedalea quercina L-15889 TaxID=1314783 RepID=A0A165PLP1_9APHY|nr:hypothetical protein DAEQUDRAFT_332183 [Daedalea quercina L-15889]
MAFNQRRYLCPYVTATSCQDASMQRFDGVPCCVTNTLQCRWPSRGMAVVSLVSDTQYEIGVSGTEGSRATNDSGASSVLGKRSKILRTCRSLKQYGDVSL